MQIFGICILYQYFRRSITPPPSDGKSGQNIGEWSASTHGATSSPQIRTSSIHAIPSRSTYRYTLPILSLQQQPLVASTSSSSARCFTGWMLYTSRTLEPPYTGYHS